jgi:flagellar biosynthetic protein FlhB
VAAIVFLGGIVVLGYQASGIVRNLSSMLQRVLSTLGPAELTEDALQKLFVGCALDIAGAVFVVTGTAIMLGVAANVAQGGLVLSTYRLGLRLENLNPATGFKRLMPGAAGGELLKSLFTVGAVAFMAYTVYSGAVGRLPRLVFMSPGDIAGSIGGIVYEFSIKCGVLLLLLGAVDYYLNRRRFESSIRMTKQEVKDEARNAEGNPEIRSRIRRRQREIALRSMMADVPKADVVITNPTHYAVALRYKAGMSAPVVVAKGKGYVALRIREIAKEHDVPFVENKPLAQALFKTVEIGRQIPVELFKAVAEVLAHVYRLKSMRL